MNHLISDSEHTVEILQREYGFGVTSKGYSGLTTTRVSTCIVWCGVDENRSVGFLCHFDFPCMAEAVPRIVGELAELVDPGTRFESYLCGGRSWLPSWSGRTRRKILEQYEESENLKIDVLEGAYSEGLLGKPLTIEISTSSITWKKQKPRRRRSWADRSYQCFRRFSTSGMRRAPGSV